MAVENFLAGQDLIAADVNTWFTPVAAVKGADQSVTSSTVLVNDTALVLPLLANRTYEVWMEGFWLPITGGATPGLSYDFTAPAGATFTYSLALPAPQVIVLGLAGSGGIAAGGSLFSAFSLHGICIVGANAGNLQFQFAQSTLSATSTTMKAGSFITARAIA